MHEFFTRVHVGLNSYSICFSIKRDIFSAIKFTSTYFENEQSESHPALGILHRLTNASSELGTGVSKFWFNLFINIYVAIHWTWCPFVQSLLPVYRSLHFFILVTVQWRSSSFKGKQRKQFSKFYFEKWGELCEILVMVLKLAVSGSNIQRAYLSVVTK